MTTTMTRGRDTAPTLTWQALTDAAITMLGEQDKYRWELGAIVDTVLTSFNGERGIKAFCETTKAKPKTMYGYAEVYRWYPPDLWQEFPLLRWSQWREAKTYLKDLPVALKVLERANDKNMRYGQFVKLCKRIAKMRGVPSTGVDSLINGEMTVDELIARLLKHDSSTRVKVSVKAVSE